MMVKTNTQLFASVRKMEKQINDYEGRIKELKRDLSGSKSQSTKTSIRNTIHSYEGIIKELKRDMKGTRDQIY